MLSVEEARDQIANRVAVTRADIVAAKTYLMNLGSGLIEIEPQSVAWAGQVAPAAAATSRSGLRMLSLDADDVDAQVATVARFLSARLAMCSAAWELVREGIFFAAGPPISRDPGWEHTSRGYSGGMSWDGQLTLLFPSGIQRPRWHQAPSEILDSDLYLQRLQPLALHGDVERALRIALECFRRDLFVPCVAMLGSASEGAWLEMGQRLAASAPGDPLAAKLAADLANRRTSTWGRIDSACRFYERPAGKPLHVKTGVTPARLRQTQQWSDQIRESRNVLHWGVSPSVPNTYEKVAILLMDAVSELDALHRVRNAC
jgi:hypothetical protein